MRTASHAFDPNLSSKMTEFDVAFNGVFDVSSTGKLYDQRRETCVQRTFRAPLADTAYWGSISETPLQQLEARLSQVCARLEKAHGCAKKVASGAQLTPTEQQFIKPRDPAALKLWKGHDYHVRGSFTRSC